MTYIEGFVVAVPAANKEAYRQHAATAAPLFLQFGATRLVECWGDDVPDGKINDFKGSVKAMDDEIVLFSWIEFPSRQVRDSAHQKMMADPRMEEMSKTMPFDAMRMIFGGFEVVGDDGATATMGYVDGMVCAVPHDNRAAYEKFSSRNGDLLKEFGATRVVDAWGDDVSVGKITDFQRAVMAQEGEKVVYSWIEWPSREARDAGWARAMSDPRMMEGEMPFDGSRMIHGGFRPILDAQETGHA